MQEYLPKYAAFIKPTVFIVVGLILLGFSAFLVIQSGVFSQTKVEVLEGAPVSASQASPSVSPEIMVEVAGEVAKPGVYKLPPGARVQDALVAAGNVLASADEQYIQKSINKAAKLVDSQKIYIPKKGEVKVPVVEQTPVLGTTTQSTNASLISINSASQAELESLPGIGPVTAKKIIDARPFGSLEELTSKKTVSSKVFGEIKDKISL